MGFPRRQHKDPGVPFVSFNDVVVDLLQALLVGDQVLVDGKYPAWLAGVCGAVVRVRGAVQLQSERRFGNFVRVRWQLLRNSSGNRVGDLAELVVDQRVQLVAAVCMAVIPNQYRAGIWFSTWVNAAAGTW